MVTIVRPDVRNLAPVLNDVADLHRYNLKRKVAGLPPVTREWFEARKAQLAQAHAAGAAQAVPAGHVRVWWDPLTRKTFRNEATYQNHVRSNKYQELVGGGRLT
jgi:pre-60S factor REI1